MNKPAATTAKLGLINAQRFANEKSKEYSRLRISKNTLRQLSGRERIHDPYVEELTEEFARLGWHFFFHTDTEYGLLKIDKVNVWAKIGVSRVRDLIQAFDNGNYDAVDKEYENLFGGNEDSSLIEDE